MMQCTISPLAHDGGALDAALVAAEAGIPVGFMTMASCAFSGPATIAGSLVVGNAEVISALALIQLAYPGAPVYYAAAQTAMDLRSGAYTGGGPEDFLFGAATNELADFYDVPLSMGAYATGAKAPDWQAGLENGLSAFMASVAGSDMLLGAGLLHGSRIWSFEQLMLDTEIDGIVKAMLRGIPTDDVSLALEAIARGGAGRRVPDAPAYPDAHARAVAGEIPGPAAVRPVGRGPGEAAPRGARARPYPAPRPPAGAAGPGAGPRARPPHRGACRGPGDIPERGHAPLTRPAPHPTRSTPEAPLMRPRFEILEPALIERILDEALQLLREPGVKVEEPEAIALLVAGGATVDGDRVRIGEPMVRRALDTVPHAFDLFDRAGRPAVRYGQGVVHFDPGSSGVAVLDPETLDTRQSQAADLARLIRVADALPAYDAVSTAIVCHDVPTGIGDLYRLFVVLVHSSKPIVTGAFTPRGTDIMLDLLALDAGGRAALAEKPRAVFDVCPSPPLTWSEFACRNVMDLARAHVPAELISMPLAGVAAPVTLVGAIVQHAAESLAGVVLHQLAEPGAPIVWGGAPTIVDMRTGSTPMGAIETSMIDAGYAAVGKSLGLPTHAYLGATDAKVIDAQAGLETGMTALVGGARGDRHDLRGRDAGLPARAERGEAGHRRGSDRDGAAAPPRDRDADGDAGHRVLRGRGARGAVPGAGGHAAAVPGRAVPAVEDHRPQLAAGVAGRRRAGRVRAGPGPGRGAGGGVTGCRSWIPPSRRRWSPASAQRASRSGWPGRCRGFRRGSRPGSHEPSGVAGRARRPCPLRRPWPVAPRNGPSGVRRVGSPHRWAGSSPVRPRFCPSAAARHR